MKKIFIYTLSDEKGNVKYVGQTIDPNNRLYRHIYEAKKVGKKNRRCAWIKSLLNKGEKPILEIIDEVDFENWVQFEKYWIAQFKAWGFDLVNDSLGGEGSYGRIVREETKKKMSLSKKGKIPKNINLFKNSTSNGVVVQYDLNGKKIAEYESANYVKNILLIKNVCNVINKKRKTAGGFKWMYKSN